MEGIWMYLVNLPMSQVSTVIMGPTGLFMYESSSSISRTFPILLAMIVRVFLFLNCSWRFENCTFIMCENKVSTPCTLVSKFVMYHEKERFKSLHSTAVISLANLAFFSSVKSTLKKPLVSKVTYVYEAGRCNLRQSWKALIVGLPPKAFLITIFCVLRTTLSCISSTISGGKSTFSSSS